MSTQSVSDLKEMVDRLHIPYDILSDRDLKFTKLIKLPTFKIKNFVFIKRLTLIVEHFVIIKVFYPIFPPDLHIYEVSRLVRKKLICKYYNILLRKNFNLKKINLLIVICINKKKYIYFKKILCFYKILFQFLLFVFLSFSVVAEGDIDQWQDSDKTYFDLIQEGFEVKDYHILNICIKGPPLPYFKHESNE